MNKIITTTLLGLTLFSGLASAEATPRTNNSYIALSTGVSLSMFKKQVDTRSVAMNSKYSAVFSVAYGRRFDKLGFELNVNRLGAQKYKLLNTTPTVANYTAGVDFNYYFDIKNNLSIKAIAGVAYVMPIAKVSASNMHIRANTAESNALAAKVGVGGQFAINDKTDFVTSVNYLRVFKKGVDLRDMVYVTAGVAF
jgi:hypothetical protein